MGCCFSVDEESNSSSSSAPRDPPDGVLVPIPLPHTMEEWGRAGVPALLRVHNWLRVRALENAPLTRGSDRLLVRMAYFIPPLDAMPTPSFSGLASEESEEGEAIEEDDTALRATAANVGNAAHGAPNLLKIPVWRRAASWALANTALLAAHCDVSLQLPLEGGACPTLSPTLPTPSVRTLLQIFREASPTPGTGFIQGPDVALLLGVERKGSLATSVFFPLLFHACTMGGGGLPSTLPSATAATLHPAHSLRLTAPQWVTAVDALCSLSEEGLLRLSFYYLARVGLALEYEEGMGGGGRGGEEEEFEDGAGDYRGGVQQQQQQQQHHHLKERSEEEVAHEDFERKKRGEWGVGEGAVIHSTDSSLPRAPSRPPTPRPPPPTPFIAVSSLTRFFPAFRAAAKDSTHPSRPLLQELKLRARALYRAEVGGGGSPKWHAKEVAYSHFIAGAKRGLLPLITGEGGGASSSSSSSSGGGGGGVGSYHHLPHTLPPPLAPIHTTAGRRGSSKRAASARSLQTLQELALLQDWGEEADRARAAHELAKAATKTVKASWRGGVGGGGGSPVASLVALMEPIAAVCTGPEDMLSWDDYRFAFKASPASFFDLIYFQRQLRKCTLGIGFWQQRAAALAAHNSNKADASASSSSSSSSSPSSPPLYYGYDPAFAARKGNPAYWDVLPRRVGVPPLAVPPTLIWALFGAGRRGYLGGGTVLGMGKETRGGVSSSNGGGGGGLSPPPPPSAPPGFVREGREQEQEEEQEEEGEGEGEEGERQPLTPLKKGGGASGGGSGGRVDTDGVLQEEEGLVAEAMDIERRLEEERGGLEGEEGGGEEGEERGGEVNPGSLLLSPPWTKLTIDEDGDVVKVVEPTKAVPDLSAPPTFKLYQKPPPPPPPTATREGFRLFQPPPPPTTTTFGDDEEGGEGGMEPPLPKKAGLKLSRVVDKQGKEGGGGGIGLRLFPRPPQVEDTEEEEGGEEEKWEEGGREYTDNPFTTTSESTPPSSPPPPPKTGGMGLKLFRVGGEGGKEGGGGIGLRMFPRPSPTEGEEEEEEKEG